MAVITIPIRSVSGQAPIVVEIPLEDPVSDFSPRVARLKREPVVQKNNRVAPGHEGSRRRRRQEMQHLLGCPQRVEPSLEDWYPGPVASRTVSWEKLSTIDPERNYSALPTTKQSAPRDENQLPRALRRELKKVHVSPAFVYGIEKEMRDMIDPATAEPEYEVVASSNSLSAQRSVHISIDAPTEKARSYSRWWIHMISRYYNLHSYSTDFRNSRVACIDLKDHKLPSVWFSDLI